VFAGRLRWPSKNHRDYQTRGGADAPRTLVDHPIARGPGGPAVHVVSLRIGYGPDADADADADERVWRLSLPLN
jgi:hypothetical protein